MSSEISSSPLWPRAPPAAPPRRTAASLPAAAQSPAAGPCTDRHRGRARLLPFAGSPSPPSGGSRARLRTVSLVTTWPGLKGEGQACGLG
eukprot:6951053-Prymnesium_polylepis.1